MTLDKETNDKLRSRFNPDGSRLREVQMRMLEMLGHFDELCRRHGIKYWLSSGTCLGALRHGGFIPWDDDVDIEMEYRDYRRLIKILRNNPPAGYVLHDRFADIEYMLPFPKFRDLNSHIEELNGQDRRWKYRGCYFDIFTVMPSSSLLLHRLALCAHNVLVRRPCRIRGERGRHIMQRIGYFLFYDMAQPLFRLLGWVGAGHRRRQPPGSAFHMSRDSRDFRRVKYVPYENMMLPVPENADAYLTRIYGDWRKMPAIDDIEQHILNVTLC